MAEQKYRLPGSSYVELKKIIIAYEHFKEKASTTDISKRAAIDPTIVSRNAGFLVETGIIESGQKKAITTRGAQLARALEHQVHDEIQNAWRACAEPGTLFDTVLSAVRIRQGMEPSNLKSHIAYTAGQSRTRFVMTGAQAIIDILLDAGLLSEQDGQLVATSEESLLSESAVPMPSSSEASKLVRVHHSQPTGTPISIQLQIQCSPEELGDLGPKVRKLLKDLSAPEKE